MSEAVLELRGMEKRYFGFAAVSGVDMRVEAGCVLGLVGENGAGKSTLLNLVAGVVSPDAGDMCLWGRTYAPQSPSDAADAGVALVHQDLNLFGNLSVAENLFLADLPRSGFGPLRWLDRRALAARCRETLVAVRLDVDPRTRTGALSPGERQLVEIAKALVRRPKVLLLDEPTTSLSQREASRLFELIERLRRDGMAIVYVSHALDDVLRLSDAIVVLRDGKVQAAGPAKDFDASKLIPLMVGRTIDTVFPKREHRSDGESLLEVRQLSRSNVVENISFTLHRGEVLGLAGLMGSGRTELARMIYGLEGYDRGEVLLGGEKLPKRSPRTSVARGLAFVAENRRDEGLLSEDTVVANVALASLPRFARRPLGIVAKTDLLEQCNRLADRLKIACRSRVAQPVKTLSGGNQQKVVLARWLLRRAQIFILDEPTRGVDVGARQHIYELLNELVREGAGIVLISSEIEELIGMCDRVLVMSAGIIRDEMERAAFDRDRMLQAALSEVA